MEKIQEFDFQIIVNLNSGNGEAKKKLEDFQRFLRDKGYSFRTLPIETYLPVDDIKEKENIRIKKGVVCIGGDGTVSSAVGYIYKNNFNVPIGIIPCGTANFISSYLGYDERSCKNELFLSNSIQLVDVGVFEFNGNKEFFLLGVGIGFEKNFLLLSRRLKKNFGIFSYILSALKEIFSLEKIHIDLQYDSSLEEIKVCMLTILNIHPRVFTFLPLFSKSEASAEDGILNLYFVEYKNKFLAILGILGFHIWGEKFELVKCIKGREFVLGTKEKVDCQIDGEVKGLLPGRVYLLDRRISFFVPQN